jgi:hypothetical protein
MQYIFTELIMDDTPSIKTLGEILTIFRSTSVTFNQKEDF